MKTGRGQHVRGFLRSGIKKSFIYQTQLVLLFAVLFVFSRNIAASENSILVINEIYATGNDDWIEIYNNSNEDINLSENNFRIYKSLTSSFYLLMRFGNLSDGLYPGGTVIKAHGYYLIVRDDVDNKELLKIADAICTKNSFTWDENKYTFYLGGDVISDAKDKDIVDKVGYGDINNFEGENPAPKIVNNNSIGRLNGKDTDDNGMDFTVQNATPKKENKKREMETIDPPKVYAKGIFINELFPAPSGADEEGEFIELYNSSDDSADLVGWKLQDYKRVSGVMGADLPIDHTFLLDEKYCAEREEKDNCQINSKKYIVIKGNDYYEKGLTLNNTNGDVIGLTDPAGKLIMQVDYPTAKENLSYSFDGMIWHWGKETKGRENILNNQPYGTLNRDQDVFKNVYADFSISTGDLDGDKIKVTWDFGDGHKSYLSKTRHKYEAVGIYNASVKLSDGSEDVLQNFIVEVKKFPHPDVAIIAVNANPKGSDSEFETITIENKSKKKIDLNGWSIATGTKTLANHPISEKLILKKKEIKEITRKFSKFSLNNKKGKIELRYPDGKVSSDIKYDHGKTSIEEDEIYKKVKGGWEWMRSQKSIKSVKSIKQEDENISSSGISNGSSNTETDEVIPDQTSSPSEERTTVKKTLEENKLFVLNNDQVKIELLKSEPRVLGAEIVREVDGIYFLTPETPVKDHYAIILLKDISSSLNLLVNYLLNNLR